MTPLRATLRLQFHRGFTLADALPLVDYFADLGISHLYASPLLTARTGSMHGYDVVDPTRVNPELGGEPALLELVQALRRRGMGLILDIVSNHMAVGGSANPWWLSVLEWGRHSPYAKFFDIQWQSPDPLLTGQLLIPFLRSDYAEVLEAGEIPLRFVAARGRFHAEHFEHHFPISPPSYAELLQASGDPALVALASRFAGLGNGREAQRQALELQAELARLASSTAVAGAIEQALEHYDGRQADGFNRLHQLFERQHYRLASWRTAADDINWRRFFDINELGGLRVERPEVFEATHGKVFELIERGLIDVLRIDHIDGLADPRGYCRKLRRRVDGLLKARPADCRLEHFPIYVEKILGPDEQLHQDWQVDGTTGYEFMNQVSLLQHDPKAEAPLKALWHSLSGRPADFLEEVREARQLVLSGSLAGDFESVAQALLRVARGDLRTRDLTLGAIRRALMALIVHFPVYRTYISAYGRSPDDEPFFQQALQGARQHLPEVDWPLLEHLQRWLGGEALHSMAPGRARSARKYAIARFQQLTSPAAAKAVEDTAFYRSAVLLSRNDMGFDPQHLSQSPAQFHQCNLERSRRFPNNLLTTATHDHKRGEDIRARLAVLSERHPWYAELCTGWLRDSAVLQQALPEGPTPCPGDRLMLLQTLLGSWPLSLAADDSPGLQAYSERVLRWQEKALREAKLHSSWNAPHEGYESACRQLVQALLLKPQGADLRRRIAAAADAIAPAGALNSLVQCALRLTSPGVPDLYQGTEFWDFSLVDPDNRQAVDYARRRTALSETDDLATLLAHWRDGRIKQRLIQRLLDLRRRLPALFAQGRYLPLQVVGEHAERVLAFARVHGQQQVVLLLPRLSAALLGHQAEPRIPAAHWGDTQVLLPESWPVQPLSGLFSTREVTPLQGRITLSQALAEVPLGVLTSAAPFP
ncbi:MAG: malto-oligosyltrehalose synthase [Pseudomonas sp.]|uniref:malto-oligosyltrehalose synthase n=1 Tax=Pseudomonas sp. TaxID=306 RepID=UPI0033944617